MSHFIMLLNQQTNFYTHFMLQFNVKLRYAGKAYRFSICSCYLSKGIRTSNNMKDNLQQKNCEEHKSEQQNNEKSGEKTEKDIMEKACKPYPYCVICKAK